jgi:hypothetical protein
MNISYNQISHAVFIAFIDHSNDKVHEHDISYDHNNQPDSQSQRLVLVILFQKVVEGEVAD